MRDIYYFQKYKVKADINYLPPLRYTIRIN